MASVPNGVETFAKISIALDRTWWHRPAIGGDTRLKLMFFLWLNWERTLEKRCGKMGVERRRQLKRSFLSRGDDWKRSSVLSRGWHDQLPPRVTPTQWRHCLGLVSDIKSKVSVSDRNVSFPLMFKSHISLTRHVDNEIVKKCLGLFMG